jgi:hypothetical protein
MKYAICLFLIGGTTSWATTVDFNKAIREDVRKEIKKDEHKFKKEAKRAPASISVEGPILKEPSKIDKNLRQIGPNKW